MAHAHGSRTYQEENRERIDTGNDDRVPLVCSRIELLIVRRAPHNDVRRRHDGSLASTALLHCPTLLRRTAT